MNFDKHLLPLKFYYPSISILTVNTLFPYLIQLLDLFYVCRVFYWTFPECHINGTILYVAFYAWLLSISIMLLKPIHVVGCISSFHHIAEYQSVVWMGHSLFIYSPIDGHLCFQFWVIMNEVALKICLQILVWMSIFILLGKYLKMELLCYKVSECFNL